MLTALAVVMFLRTVYELLIPIVIAVLVSYACGRGVPRSAAVDLALGRVANGTCRTDACRHQGDLRSRRITRIS
jgi:hypothetical protein